MSLSSIPVLLVQIITAIALKGRQLDEDRLHG
jgi:hypothetical protein